MIAAKSVRIFAARIADEPTALSQIDIQGRCYRPNPGFAEFPRQENNIRFLYDCNEVAVRKASKKLKSQVSGMAFQSRKLRNIGREVNGSKKLKGLPPKVYRTLDVVVASMSICFLAPVFALVALGKLPYGDSPEPLRNFGSHELLSLFRVIKGEMSLFTKD